MDIDLSIPVVIGDNGGAGRLEVRKDGTTIGTSQTVTAAANGDQFNLVLNYREVAAGADGDCEYSVVYV